MLSERGYRASSGRASGRTLAEYTDSCHIKEPSDADHPADTRPLHRILPTEPNLPRKNTEDAGIFYQVTDRAQPE